MKKKAMILVAIALLLPAASVLAFHPDTDCDSCHIPHEDASLEGMPLWSGTITTLTDFTEYDSETLNAEPGDPASSTLVCLACHDGVGGGAHLAISDGTGDLSTSHPMEFVYDTQLADEDKELAYPETDSSNEVNGDGTIAQDMLEQGTGKLKCVSCHEIHENGLHSQDIANGNVKIPHLKDIFGVGVTLSSGGDIGEVDDYRVTYAALCRTCHEK